MNDDLDFCIDVVYWQYEFDLSVSPIEAVIGDESEGGDCDEVICAG